MTDPRETLTRIRAQADEATDGPWRHVSIFEVGGYVEDGRGRELFDWAQDDAGTICLPDADAEFIAAARTTVPRLTDALQAVLNLHKPGRTFHGHDFSQPLCTCGTPLPCPTVAAVTNALEGANV